MEHLLVFVYDEMGSPVALKYRTSAYAAGVYDLFFYEKNLQGDIIGIYNASGTKIGTYVYNAFGAGSTTLTSGITTLERKIVSTYNPFRYRGYYYDTETSLYYLQSRYYDPNLGRFINPDSIDVITASPDQLTDKNLFAYCDNNPIMRTDGDGEFWETVFDVISLAVSVAEVIQDPTDVMAWVGLAADVASLAIPGVTGGGTVVRAISKTDDVVDAVKAVNKVDDAIDASAAVQKGWKVGDDITSLTKAGNSPSWSTVRQRYWKNEAFYNPSKYPNDLGRMKKGLAPIGDDGFSMELHHPFGRKGANFYIFEPFTQSQHRYIHYGNH